MLKLLLAALAVLVVALALLTFNGQFALVAVAHPIHFLAAIALAILVLSLIALRPDQRRRVLRFILPAIAMVGVAVGAAGCSSLGQQGSADLLKQLDQNFAQCDRHITFQAGVGVVTPGAAVSGSVDCKGNGLATPSTVPPLSPLAPAQPASATAPGK
jgi:hypothetical protein